LRSAYDINAHRRKKATKTWFGGKPAQGPRDLIERHAALSTSPSTNTPSGKLSEGTSKPVEGPARKRKIKMSQTMVVDLDAAKKSDRAEVAILHTDVVHNSRNA